MKNTFLLFISILFFQFVSAQQKKIDSLEHVLSNIKVDSIYLEKLKLITQEYRGRNSNVHLHFIKKYIKESNRANDIKNKADAIRELSVYYRDVKKLDSALIKCNEAIVLYKSINREDGVCAAKNDKAILLKNKGDYPNAVKNYKDVIAYLETQGEKAYENVLWVKMNMGALYSQMNEIDTAIQYYTTVYNDPKAKGNPEMIGRVSINLSNNYRKKKDYDKALYYAFEAEKIIKRPRSLANLYSSFANIYREMKAYKKADVYFKKAINLYTSLNLTHRVNDITHNMAYNFLDQKKYDEAEYYFLKSNKVFLQSDDLYSLQQNYQGLTDLYYKKKNYKKAFDFYTKNRTIKDSILHLEKQKAISEIEIKYDTEKAKQDKEVAEKETVIARLESQKNRSLFLGSTVIAGLILLMSVFYFSKQKTKKKAQLIVVELQESQKRLAIEKQYRNSELKALKAQMNPHFIFNALNSIQDYIVLNKKNLASDYLGKFANLIRNYLYFSNTGFISIPDELHNLNLYLELEKLRFEEQLEYTFQVDDNANNDTICIPTMLIQPYVENALKHGLLHKKENRKLRISIAKISDKIIECVIEDNGVGREKSNEINKKRQTPHKSFALKATTERLDLLNYGSEKKIGVEIIDLKENNKATGTKVILKIPIKKQQTHESSNY